MNLVKIKGDHKGFLVVFLVGLLMCTLCLGLSTGGALWLSKQDPDGMNLVPYHVLGTFVLVPKWLYFFCRILNTLAVLGAALAAAGLITFILMRRPHSTPHVSTLMQIPTLAASERRI